MYRALTVLAVISITLPTIALADGLYKEKTASTTSLDDESVVHHHSLAVHLGLTSEEAVFRAPRKFRSKELNEIRLDESDDTSQETIDPIVDNRDSAN